MHTRGAVPNELDAAVGCRDWVLSQLEKRTAVSAPAEAQKKIAFVLYPGLTPLDLIGPLQVMSALPLIDPSFRTTVVGARADRQHAIRHARQPHPRAHVRR